MVSGFCAQLQETGEVVSSLEKQKWWKPRNRYCAESAGEVLGGQVTSRGTSAVMRGASQWSSRESLFSVLCVRDSFGVFKQPTRWLVEFSTLHCYH